MWRIGLVSRGRPRCRYVPADSSRCSHQQIRVGFEAQVQEGNGRFGHPIQRSPAVHTLLLRFRWWLGFRCSRTGRRIHFQSSHDLAWRASPSVHLNWHVHDYVLYCSFKYDLHCLWGYGHAICRVALLLGLCWHIEWYLGCEHPNEEVQEIEYFSYGPSLRPRHGYTVGAHSDIL